MHHHMSRAAATLAAAAGAALALPALASGHATISPSQPQGAALTSARTSYAVRAPNEKDAQATWKVVMYVPAPVQEAISVRHSPGWKIRLVRRDTGKVSESGGKVFATSRISWTAVNPDEEILPGMFGEWGVRFQNPAAPVSLCFPMVQYYRNANGSRRRPELVHWTGPATSATPASCVEVKASA